MNTDESTRLAPTEVEGGGHKAGESTLSAKDEITAYLKSLLKAHKVGIGYIALNLAQMKCLLDRKAIGAIADWWRKQPKER